MSAATVFNTIASTVSNILNFNDYAPVAAPEIAIPDSFETLIAELALSGNMELLGDALWLMRNEDQVYDDALTILDNEIIYNLTWQANVYEFLNSPAVWAD